MLFQQRTSCTYEDLFMDRYDQLLAFAMQLTDRDLHEAEDLVHDVFVKFALTQPDLQKVENLDGYLYISLRNTYRSQVRRAGRGSMQQLSLLDYDSVELGLRFVESRHLTHVQDELFLICRYACWRKETSKAASVLILRYFLGYFPGEIAKILQIERQAVAESLRVARAEARLIVQDPHRLGFVVQCSTPEPRWMHARLSTDDLLTALWNQIFGACSGACPPHRELRERYQNAERRPVDRDVLAHLTSCRRCLDEVNRTLGLSLLADRNPTDFNRPDPGSNGGMGENGLKKGGSNNGHSGNDSKGSLKRLRRRVRLVYEHDPKELRIAVNGQWLGGQEVAAELNKQTLNLSEIEQISFIEIYSEQEVRMAYLVVDEPPKGEFEQEEIVELSDGRRIEVGLSFKDVQPALQVVYHNPFLRAETAPSQTSLEGYEEDEDIRPATDNRQSTTGNRYSDERRTIPQRWWSYLTWILWKPQGAVVIGLILIALWLVIDHLNRPTAANLLSRATTGEASMERLISGRPDQVFHRTMELEELRADNTVLARRRVEVWRSAAKKIQVRRLYDEHGLLIAGEWQTMNGDSKLYRRRGESAALRSSGPELNIANRASWIASGSGRAPTIDDLWRMDLSAKDFTGLIGNAEPATIEERPHAYVISYRNPSQALVGAALTLDRGSLRPIEQRFHFRYANEDRVVVFVEKLFEPKPVSEAGGQVFDVDSELIEVSVSETSNNGSSQTTIAQPPSLSTSSASHAAPAELEIRTLILLHRIGADLGEEVSITRGAGGKLKVEATVETTNRQAEILRAMAPIANNPAVLIRIETFTEALKRRSSGTRRSTPEMIEEYGATGNTIPAQSDLRVHFARKLADRKPSISADEGEEAIEDEIRQFSTRMLKQSQKALLRAYALKRLASRFSPEEIRVLDPEVRAGWLSLVREHARIFADETGAMRQQLQPVIGATEPADGGPAEVEGKGEARLIAAIDRLFKLGIANNRSVRAAFAIPTRAPTGSPIKMAQLWRSLIDAEKLSREIQKEVAGNL
jgi:DNA-directed RNA polymerase specialized sigma24 family protein